MKIGQKFFNKGSVRGHPHNPARSVQELAEEFKVSVMSLTMLLRHDKDAPKQQLAGDHCGRPVRYFDPVEVRRWWKKRNEKKENSNAK